jgi:hypothetical protein
MKKLLSLMLGLSFALGSVAVTFAQDTKDDKMTTTKKAKKKKAAKKSTTDTSAPKN